MKARGTTITLAEHERVPIAELECHVRRAGINALVRLNREAGTELFTINSTHVKATQHVGLVLVGRNVVQVVPKIFKDNLEDDVSFLFFLLQYCERLRFKQATPAPHATVKGDVFDFFVHLFATTLHRLLVRDFKRDYERVSDNRMFLRGKLDIRRQAPLSMKDPARYACVHQVHAADNLLNRCLLHVTRLLHGASKSMTNRRVLGECRAMLADVSRAHVTVADVDKIRLTRLNAAYHPLVHACKMILARTSSIVSTGSMSTFSLFFDMNRLFEEFIHGYVARHKNAITGPGGEPLVASIRYQRGIGALFQRFPLVPDMVVRRRDGRVLLVDAKYKHLGGSAPVAKGDLYQAFAYARSQPEQYDVVLVYPKVSGLEERTLVHDIGPGAGTRLHVRGVDLAAIYDASTGRIDHAAMRSEMRRALS